MGQQRGQETAAPVEGELSPSVRRRLALLMRRLEFGLQREHWRELYSFCKDQNVTEIQLASGIEESSFDAEDVYRKALSLWREQEGTRSEHVQALWRRGIRFVKEKQQADKAQETDEK